MADLTIREQAMRRAALAFMHAGTFAKMWDPLVASYEREELLMEQIRVLASRLERVKRRDHLRAQKRELLELAAQMRAAQSEPIAPIPPHHQPRDGPT